MMEALPDELLLQICGHLSLPHNFTGFVGAGSFRDETAALSRLCRLSKRLQPFAQRALYHYIPELSDDIRYRLLRTLVECPHLASLVRGMYLGYGSITGPQLVSLFETARPRLNVPESLEQKILAGVEHRAEGFDHAFILLLLPNLEQLEIECFYETDFEMCDFVVETRAGADGGPPAALARLRELWLRHNDTEGTTRLKPRGLLTLPTLRTLRGWSVEWSMETQQDQAEGSPERLDGHSSVEHIDFAWSLCNGNSLSSMMSRYPGLKMLSIEWGSATVGCDDDLDFTAIGDALRKYGSSTLEGIKFDCREAFMYEEGESTGRIGSLRELSKLKTLTLPHDILVGEDDESDEDSDDEASNGSGLLQLDEVLPTSLEKLHLLSCEGDEGQLDDQIHKMIAGKKMSNLQKVIMARRRTSFRHNVSEFGWVSYQAWGKVILCTRAEYRPMSKKVEEWSLKHGMQVQI
ncbi:hypothetical protein PFICI_00120 [Pestalotiopsis fici W106-1]|uniref:F-box domain-containing protein n=1 Tax=Pestalotiopsis fici (strain W106-1 / CGMCC3.15140) TaxID=1229662 RepID=W3XLG3_PESFW|nr:uncharacterized protein PFICI_00120 [Pestalotiopsis fici W106-1]ETS86292.1 hypothetical protein PFICI_00120 [Pestalotiopsis fici W106-1]